jgi:predicted DCC family thiol-disulfide oxidoreductase YuxK
VGLLIYDADCGFCARTARWLESRGGDVTITSWQSVPSLESLGLDETMVLERAYWIASDGAEPAPGHVAIARALEASGSWRRPVGRFIRSRSVRPVASRVYQWVADNRYRMPGSTGTCRMPDAG